MGDTYNLFKTLIFYVPDVESPTPPDADAAAAAEKRPLPVELLVTTTPPPGETRRNASSGGVPSGFEPLNGENRDAGSR